MGGGFAATTIRQDEIYKYMCDYQCARGVTPTVREVQRAFGFASPQAVVSHFRALEKKGLLWRAAPGRSRCWRPVMGPDRCPTCGRPRGDTP